MTSNYPPGVTNQGFDELCWGETYRLRRTCPICHEPLPDQNDQFCSYCDPDQVSEELEEEEDNGT